MDYLISGGNKLYGTLNVYGAKNCALACLGATLLTDEEVVLTNVPYITDVQNMLRLLSETGKRVVRDGDVVCVSGKVDTTVVSQQTARLIRGSTLVLGAMLARYGRVTLPLTGGCAIGARPLDIHCDGLRAFGAEVCECNRDITASGALHGTDYSLRFASVGATENLLCAATLGQGTFVLRNCAVEPEVTALAEMLVSMGAKIDGVGKSTLTVQGVRRLGGTEFRVVPDRIVAATYISAVCACGGNLTLYDCPTEYLTAFVDKSCGNAKVRRYDNYCEFAVNARCKSAGHIVTAPYPAYHTDMQSLGLTLAAMSRGKTVVTENLFENRLCHNAEQLNKMGADVRVVGNSAFVNGSKLHGADIVAADLRGGAALTVAALAAEGKSKLVGAENIERGYMNLDVCLASVGASICRVD